MPSRPPGRSSRAAVTSRPRTTSSPSGPPHSASGGSWSATSRRHAGAVGHVRRVGDDEVDRPSSSVSSAGIGHVARPAARPAVARRCPGGGVVPGPRDRAGVALDGGDPRAGELVRDRRARGRRSRCRGRRRRARGRPAQRSIAQPASCSVSGRGTNTPGPTASSRCRNGARPVRCCSGTRSARWSTSAANRAAGLGGHVVEGEQRGARHAEHCGQQQLGVHPRRVDAGLGEPARGAGQQLRVTGTLRSRPPAARRCARVTARR